MCVLCFPTNVWNLAPKFSVEHFECHVWGSVARRRVSWLVDDNEKLITPSAWRQTSPEYLINQHTKVILPSRAANMKTLSIKKKYTQNQF